MPLNPSSPLAKLMATPPRPGRLVWIGLRPGRRVSMVAVEEAVLDLKAGVVGDRYERASGPRQVTLIAAESLDSIASFVGAEAIAPSLVRRNLVVEGVNLLALKDQRIRIGGAVLEATGECHPCSRMEEALGPGGYNAMRGLGGLTARVIVGGTIRLGDTVIRQD